MGVLSDKQLQKGYFHDIGGFEGKAFVHTVAEYDGSEDCCICCTQQPQWSDSETKRHVKEWICFLQEHPTAFRALHFNTHVPQALFDAVCCQTRLEELRIKWGRYTDLTKLANLDALRYLYLGSCPGVQDITPITTLQDLIVLYIENFKRVTDYSSLRSLQKLEQLTISGPILNTIHIQDVDFILSMPQLSSVWFPNTRFIKRYTDAERETLRASGIIGVYEQEWWTF